MRTGLIVEFRRKHPLGRGIEVFPLLPLAAAALALAALWRFRPR